MTLKHYLSDTVTGIGERAYWAAYLASVKRAEAPLRESALVGLEKQLHAVAVVATGESASAAALLREVAATLRALRRQSAGSAPLELWTTLSLWAALHDYRTAMCGGGFGRQMQALGSDTPRAWRWDDARSIVLLDMEGGFTLRLWPGVSFPRSMCVLKPSHVHTLVFDSERRHFTNEAGAEVVLARLFEKPSTHYYRTDVVQDFFPKSAPVQHRVPVLASEAGQTGNLF